MLSNHFDIDNGNLKDFVKKNKTDTFLEKQNNSRTIGKVWDSWTQKPLTKSTNNNKPLGYKGKQNKEKPYRNNGGDDIETLSYNSMISGLISTTKEITWYVPWKQSVSDAIMPYNDSPDSPNDEILIGEFVE